MARRLLRWASLVLAGAAVMVALLMAGLWWWAGTEGSLDWVLQRLSRSVPLQSEGVSGSLRSGLRVQRLVWEQGGLRVEAHEVTLTWQPMALVTRTVQLDEFRAQLLRVTDQRPPSADPLQPPENLALPMRVKAQGVAIARLEWKGSVSTEAEALHGGYAFDGLGHQLRVDSLRIAGGSYRGKASLGVLGDMPLRSTLQGTVTASVPGSTATVPLQLSASAEGPLAGFQAQAVLHALQAPQDSALPQATATARITPFAAQPVPQAHADMRNIDLAALWPQAPRSRLSGQLQLQPAGAQAWQWKAELANALAGPWDAGRLPVERLDAQGEWRGKTALVQRLHARAGGGDIRAEGRWRGADAWTVDARLQGVDPAALHSRMAPVPLAGQAQLDMDAEGLAFEADLQGKGRARAAKPRKAGEGKDLAAVDLREAKVRGRWSDGSITLASLRVRSSDALLEGALTARPAQWSGSGRLRLDAPGLNARVQGALSETSGSGTLQLEGSDLARALRWLRALPEVGRSVPDLKLAGRAGVQLAWQGGWRDPAVQASANAAMLTLLGWTLQDARLALNGRLSDAQLSLRGRGEQGQRRVDVDLAGRAGRTRQADSAVWRAQLPRLAITMEDAALGQGAWRLDLRRAMDLRWWEQPARLELAAGEAVLAAPRAAQGAATPSQAVLSWQATRWGGGQFHTAGRLSGLPMAWLELLTPQLAGAGLTGNMVFDAQWAVDMGRQLRVDAGLVRRAGDVNVLADTVDGGSTRVAAGVRDARLTVAGQGENLTVSLRWDSERAGTADARLVTRMAPGGAMGWQWPANAPLGGFLRAQLPRIGVWSVLAPPGWRLRGSLAADVAFGGVRSDPRLVGRLAADDLALRSVVEGVELRDGRLRARLEGQKLLVDELVLHGAGEGVQEGTVTARGEGAWTAQGLQLNAAARLQRLRASIRDDRELTVSGELAARVDASGTDVRGRLVVDKARIVLPDELPPRLGEDVVVRSAKGNMATAQERKQREPERPPPRRPFNVAVAIDLGNDFRLQGRGLDTRLGGELQLTGETLAQPRLAGTIHTVGGEYRAYGQRLDIERGIMRFTGPLDNPVLDILAIRPHLAQRVGVQITGTVQAPFIRLHSEPDMPDAEKLTWLVTGRSSPSGGAEAALVQQAAMTLLANRRGGNSGGVAGRVGLDELSVRRDSAEGAVVTLGKRFARNFYASYERSLSGALGTLYLFYDVSRRLTVRAEAGERTGVDLIWTFSFDRAR